MFLRDQYTAAHNAAILIDRAAQGKLLVAGADRASFLHALLTNDIARLAPGTGCYSAYLTPQGRMISDMRVIETGDRMLLGVEGFAAAALAERLDKLVFSEDVQVKNITVELAELGVHGPTAPLSAVQTPPRCSALKPAGRGSGWTWIPRPFRWRPASKIEPSASRRGVTSARK